MSGKSPLFSVAMCVYKNDDPNHFEQAIISIINQTVPPSEIVLVVDGPIPQRTEVVIKKFKDNFVNLLIVRFKENMGHASARQFGIKTASNELIALMDSDDISVPNRFEKQLEEFQNDSELDVLGGQIHEFIETVQNVVGIRTLPLIESEIKKYLKARCPFNQMTVMLRKSAVLNAGGYQDWYCNEDYFLWIRMFKEGARFKNIDENLVFVRVGKEMYKRRGGLNYFKSEARLQKYMKENSIISFYRYLFNILVRIIVQVLLPNSVRGFLFQKLFRTKPISA